jgi:hypothetical protein
MVDIERRCPLTQTIRAFASPAQAFSWLVCARIARLLL